mgnify:CR=1 FL=1
MERDRRRAATHDEGNPLVLTRTRTLTPVHARLRPLTFAHARLRFHVFTFSCAQDLRGTPAALKLKLDELCTEKKLVVKRRPKRGACWTYCLSESELYRVLSARDVWA